MNAGRIDIEIAANYAKLESQLKQVESKASAQGREVGQKFGTGFVDRAEQQIKKVLTGATSIAAIDGFVRNMAEAIRNETSIGQALIDILKSAPVAGAAFELGQAISGRIINSLSGDSPAEVAQRRAGEMEWTEKQAEAKSKLDEETASKARAIEINMLADRLKAEQKINYLREKGIGEADGKELFAIRERIEQRQLEYDLQKDLAKATTDEERAALKRQYYEREQLEDAARNKERQMVFNRESERTMKRREQLLKEQDEQKKAQEKIASAEREAMEEMGERAREQGEARMRLEEKIAQIQGDMIDAQTAGITGASTAIGTFKFDAYPDSDKRKNDEMQLEKLDRIRDAIESTALLTGESGFL